MSGLFVGLFPTSADAARKRKPKPTNQPTNHLKENVALEISTYLHFANNKNIAARRQPEYDWLAKVHPVITALQKSFLEANNPHRENAIDEAMMKFKDRSSVKQ